MKPRSLGVAILLLLVVLGAWWKFQSHPPQKLTLANLPSKALVRPPPVRAAPPTELPAAPVPTPPSEIAVPAAHRIAPPDLSAPLQPTPAAPAQKSADDPAAVAEPRESLKTAIPDLIRLIDAKDMATLIRHYFPPDDLANMSDDLPMDQMITMITQEPEFAQWITDLRQALEFVKGKSPELRNNGGTAAYYFSPAFGDRSYLKFSQHNGLWYIDE